MKKEMLWELPIFSQELSGVNLYCDGIEAKLELTHCSDIFVIQFIGVCCYRHSRERFMDLNIMDGCYDKMTMIQESEWISELKKLHETAREQMSLKSPKHYAIYLDSVGLYEFIADNVQLYKNGLEIAT